MRVFERIRMSRIAVPGTRMRRRRSPPSWAPFVAAGALLAAVSVVAVMMKRGDGRQPSELASASAEGCSAASAVPEASHWEAQSGPAFS